MSAIRWPAFLAQTALAACSLVCGIILCGGCNAPSMATQAGQSTMRYSLDFSRSKTDFVDSIAISYDHGRLLVPVVIGGRTYRFMLDTGSSQTVVYRDSPIDGLASIGQIVSHDAAGHSNTVPVVLMPPIQIGSVVFSDCQATIQQRPARVRDIDGLLGFDLVCSGLHMKIDQRQGLLIITDRKKHFAQEGGLSCRYTLKYHVPYLEVSPFVRFSEPTLFDTGSRQLYAMNTGSYQKALDEEPDLVELQTEGRSLGRYAMGHQGTEATGEVAFLWLYRLMVAGHELRQVHTITTQGDSHIGGRLLEYGSVIFNPNRHRLTFQPYSEADTTLVANHQVPILFVLEQGQEVVGLVFEGGSAYAAGFRQGDIVLSRGADDSYKLRDTEGRIKEVKWVRTPQ